MISCRLPLALLLAATAGLTFLSPHSVAEGPKEEVRYRCVEWQTKHIHDNDKAGKIAKTLADLKCEVERAEHDGHIDLKYRCPEWRKMTLKTHEEAHKWEEWLKQYGFETEHHH
ncbi:hypothetical protein [Roseimaritima sediminicola]|uniref:hypothetical protein n=1 Tax=Roseimaritima sediminicola TaxID=2662066 RepID=UPI001F3512D5|nr:hypothetical protein [Roseimaritima sediminicola]